MSAKKSYPSYKKCKIKNCFETDVLSNTRSLYQLPADPDRAKLWINVLKLENQKLPKSFFVCDRHFIAEDYLSTRLKKTAIPSIDLFIEDPETPCKEKLSSFRSNIDRINLECGECYVMLFFIQTFEIKYKNFHK